jgi:hypothetical protein
MKPLGRREKIGKYLPGESIISSRLIKPVYRREKPEAEYFA